MSLRVIISGGGTGGHIFPAISIANALKSVDGNIEILFVGAQGKMEMERVPKAGFDIIGLPITGFNRNSIIKNLKLPLKIILSLFKAQRVINRFKPHVVIGVGGYASGPLLWCSKYKGIPYFIQEQNSYAGITNRILGKSAQKVFVAYENMESFFKNSKIEITGNPVREGIKRRDNDSRLLAHKYFNIDDTKKTLLIIGGSLGARTLNECVEQYILENKESELNIIWQCGSFYNQRAQIFIKNNKRDYIKLYKFIDQMDMAYCAADLIISRAGAGTISELAVASKATIFVPSPNVAEDHQTHNAKALVSKRAAIMVKDNNAKKELFSIASKIIVDDNLLNQLEENIGNLAKNDAAKNIAKRIIELIDNRDE